MVETKSTVLSPGADRDLAAGLGVTWVGFGVNVLLVILKLWVGIVGRSQALIADGVHSISDLFSDVVVLLGLSWGRKEADEDHPYGHARIETSASLIVGILLLAVAIWIGYRAILGLVAPVHTTPGSLTIIAAALSVLLKEALYWFTIKVSRRIKSPVLAANAWHHRTDALSSVAVLVGVIAAYLNPEWWAADLIAAKIVALFVFRVGIKFIVAAFREMVDTAPNREIINDIAACAESVSGVREVHNIRARHHGGCIVVELHVVVDPQITVSEGHAIANEVEETLLNEIEPVTQVTTHIEPDPDA
jgi:cation diffusion facilitator family transporter